ncbi:hypothetical protein [Ekhidna sp.]|uniref:hypothetical protein n=1 Tax=Ekhidna sp. TaxID=2608089 RepID=UPI003B5A8F1C
MQSSSFTSKAYMSQLTIIHFALLMGVILFGAVTILLNSQDQLQNPGSDLTETLQLVASVVALIGIIASRFMSNQQLKKLQQKGNLFEKLIGYQGVLITKYALLEAPSLFGVVCFFLTGNYFFLGTTVLILAIFIGQRPTRFKLVNDLHLNQEEKAQIENPEAMIKKY